MELIVEGLVRALQGKVEQVTVATSRFESSGVLPRLFNIVEAALKQGDVNHVTGDVHFLTYLLRGSRTVLTIHDCARIMGPLDWRKRVVRALWFRIPAKQCAAITVVSESVREELLRHVDVDASKIRVISSFVPTLYTRVDKPFNAERPEFLHVGTAENKNLLRVCDALRGIDCQLHVVGVISETQRAKLEECAIRYTQHVSISTPAMHALYARCDALLFASTFEGFGMPIVEAQKVGRAVLTSNVASMPDVAADAACLIDPFDVASIRAGILRIIHDEAYRTSLVDRGFVNAERFSVDAIANSYAALYRELAGASH